MVYCMLWAHTYSQLGWKTVDYYRILMEITTKESQIMRMNKKLSVHSCSICIVVIQRMCTCLYDSVRAHEPVHERDEKIEPQIKSILFCDLSFFALKLRDVYIHIAYDVLSILSSINK